MMVGMHMRRVWGLRMRLKRGLSEASEEFSDAPEDGSEVHQESSEASGESSDALEGMGVGGV